MNTRVIEFMKAAYLKKKMDLRREGLSRRKGLRSLRDGGREENYPGKKCLWKIHPNKVTNWLVLFFFYYFFISFRRGRQYLEGEEAGGGRERAT